MFRAVDTKDSAAVEVEVQATYAEMFAGGDRSFVVRAFTWAGDCFSGKHPGYQCIDACYHDFEHTLQGTLCFSRLLHGRHRVLEPPPLPQRLFELGLLAILLHDTGYLKERGDTAGTGAKYTFTHVDRSAGFAARFLAEKGFRLEEIRAVQNMIHCTGINAQVERIPFQSDLERLVGHALGTADLLGQMAAHDYVDKLPILYEEFAEAEAFDAGPSSAATRFSSPDELFCRTPAFWNEYVLVKIDRDFGGLHRFLRDPYPTGPNEYLERGAANIERIRQRCATAPPPASE